VFTEDYQVLATLTSYYGDQLLLVKTLFSAAQQAGFVTATIGKSGAAYIQDLGRGGYFVDENTVMPRSLVTELQSAGIPLPTNVVKGYSGADAVTLAADNGNPTGRAGYNTFNTAAYDPGGVIAITSRDP
jgi:subtilase family serine protease